MSFHGNLNRKVNQLEQIDINLANELENSRRAREATLKHQEKFAKANELKKTAKLRAVKAEWELDDLKISMEK